MKRALPFLLTAGVAALLWWAAVRDDEEGRHLRIGVTREHAIEASRFPTSSPPSVQPRRGTPVVAAPSEASAAAVTVAQNVGASIPPPAAGQPHTDEPCASSKEELRRAWRVGQWDTVAAVIDNVLNGSAGCDPEPWRVLASVAPGARQLTAASSIDPASLGEQRRRLAAQLAAAQDPTRIYRSSFALRKLVASNGELSLFAAIDGRSQNVLLELLGDFRAGERVELWVTGDSSGDGEPVIRDMTVLYPQVTIDGLRAVRDGTLEQPPAPEVRREIQRMMQEGELDEGRIEQTSARIRQRVAAELQSELDHVTAAMQGTAAAQAAESRRKAALKRELDAGINAFLSH